MEKGESNSSAPASVYTSERFGDDKTGDGSESKPFKTILQAMRLLSVEPFAPIYVDSKVEEERYELVAKSQLKKWQKQWQREKFKTASAQTKEKEDAEKRSKNLEDAKKIVIEEDKSLPVAKQIKIVQCKHFQDQRVLVYGWVHRLRRQS